MRELMLELLTWAPFEKLVLGEKEYIDEILSGNYQQPPSMFHDLFLGFRDYVDCVQKREATDIGWLRNWKANHGRAHLPLLFKKICFYLMVRGALSESAFMEQIGLHVSRIREWKISPEFRKRAEADTYSVIRSYRSGTKRKYLVSLIKRLYYEAGRQVSKSTALKELPTFVDVFAGTASVAASVVTDGCPHPIVNDYDPVMVCFAWAFTFYQHEIRKKIVEFHDYLRKDLKIEDCSYDITAYERHKDKGNVFTDPEASDNPSPRTRWLWKVYEYSGKYIKKRKRFAQRHQELIMRIRSGYKDVKLVLNKLSEGDRERLRDDFNKLSKHTPDSQKGPELEDILDYALALFFYYSFRAKGVHAYYETNVDVNSYLSFLNSLQVDLSDVRNENLAVEADNLLKLQLKASSLTLESEGSFSRHLKNAEFYCKDFRDILQNNSEAEGVYYLDSPYFLTVGYDVGFSEEDHKEMLDILRGAEFKWIFSIQYKPSDEGTKTSKKRCRNQPPIIRNYGDYYRGFYAPFQLDAGKKVYMSAKIPKQAPSNLFAILFDVETAKAKGQEIYRYTREILLVNFNPLRTIPLHNSAVVLPFDLFLQYADAGMNYRDIVLKAIDWRRNYIEKNFAGKIPV